MTKSRNRIVDLDSLAAIVRREQLAGKNVAMCHGCFDVLHFGHVRHFEAAAEAADLLIVTITPDEYVGKGEGRPVFPVAQRAEVVASLRVIDWVAINRWQSAIETINLIKPDYFVKGDEYESNAMKVNPSFLLEKKTAREVGTKIVFTHEDASSSTMAVQRLTMSSTNDAG